jgi:hypothetical protein
MSVTVSEPECHVGVSTEHVAQLYSAPALAVNPLSGLRPSTRCSNLAEPHASRVSQGD